jgi:hypothetical protein
MFLRELKCNLQSGEFVVLCDFAVNYSFVLQDEAQGFHWNNAQATIHPYICNLFQEIRCFKYRAWESSNDIRLNHDSILVHTFQRYLMKFVGNTFESQLKKNVYFSDGSAKNKKS